MNVFADLPVKPVAVGIAVVLVILNILGVKESGRFQAIVVSVVMATLGVFVLWGVGSTESPRYEPFLDGGFQGLLSATGLVFVAYIGVTQVASVAEEIKRPARTIPRGIFSSILLMIVLYPALAYVMVGVTPAGDLANDVTPMTTSARQFASSWVGAAIAVVAVLALTSMANAGLLASSRYPLAMARNRLAPTVLMKISPRTSTPLAALTLNGTLMVVLIIFFPLIELAKLASAFTLLVFSLLNLAVIAFRESHLDWYRPPFKSPLYPWIQIAGIGGSLVLLSQIGIAPIVGALLITVAGVVWYRVFGRSRASRESAGRDALRIKARERILAETEAALQDPGPGSVLLAVRREISDARLRDLIRLGSQVVRSGNRIEIIRIGLGAPVDGGVHDTITDEERHFLRRVAGVASGIEIDASFVFVGGRDWRRQIQHYAEDRSVQLVMAESVHGWGLRGSSVHDMQWLSDHVTSDFLFLGNRYLDQISDIAILGSGSPIDPLKVNVANRVARAEDAHIRFVHALPSNAPGREVVSMREYHERLGELVDVDSRSQVLRADDVVPALSTVSRDADLVVLGASRARLLFVEDLVDRIGSRLDTPFLLARSHRPTNGATLTGRVLERFLE